MKTKQIIILTSMSIIAAMFIAALASCSENFVQVRLSVSDTQSIDFEQYDKIVYADLVLESLPKNYNPEKELNIFFLTDLPKIIGKDIEHFKRKEKTGKERLESIKESVKENPNSLLITGTLIFDIKSRSKIQEVTKEGKKEKGFVEVQHWDLTLKIEMMELSTGKELFKKSYSEKLSDADVSNPKYNFEKLFFKINNRFAKEIMSVKKMQRRYLLTR
jgi:hypothetical protein